VSSCPLGDPCGGSVQAPGERTPAEGRQSSWKRLALRAAGWIIIKEMLDKNTPGRDNWFDTRSQRGPQEAAEAIPADRPTIRQKALAKGGHERFITCARDLTERACVVQ